MSLKQVKGKIRSVDKTHQVTKAMEAVSAVKMRKSQERAIATRPYASAALSILQRVAATRSGAEHPMVQARPVRNVCCIVITSDKGLAGSLNSAVLQKAERALAEYDRAKAHIGVIAIGKKANEYFAARGYTIVQAHENVGDAVAVDEMRRVTNFASDAFRSGTYDECIVAYQQFQSTFEQKAVARTLLPLNIESLAAVVDEIVPQQGKFADITAGNGAHQAPEYTIEPDRESVLNALLPHLTNVMLYHTLLEAKASEHSARMVAMKNASDKASELSRELNLEYNKERQAVITREVSEITGGIEAMASV